MSSASPDIFLVDERVLVRQLRKYFQVWANINAQTAWAVRVSLTYFLEC